MQEVSTQATPNKLTIIITIWNETKGMYIYALARHSHTKPKKIIIVQEMLLWSGESKLAHKQGVFT